VRRRVDPGGLAAPRTARSRRGRWGRASRLAALLALALVAASCYATVPRTGDEATRDLPPETRVPAGRSTELTIAMLGHARWAEAGLEVAFTNVVSDSRCPEGTNCVWAGNAVVELTATRGGQSETFAVRLGPGSTGDATPDFVDRLGFRFEIVRLDPVPAAGRTIDRLSYQVRVRVVAL